MMLIINISYTFNLKISTNDYRKLHKNYIAYSDIFCFKKSKIMLLTGNKTIFFAIKKRAFLISDETSHIIDIHISHTLLIFESNYRTLL